MTPHATDPADPPFWDQVRALFGDLLDRPADQREAALRDSPAPAAVKAEVRSLLAHAVDEPSGPGGFLASPLALVAPSPGRVGATDGSDPAGRTGQRLGPWAITGLLGRGGMGEVWAAQRADGAYDGRAAIKVLRQGLDSQQVLARFAQEQRALARLNHPHIAHLLDAGRTADGLPYFVMEAVDGQPIDRACAGQPLEARLALFLQLADAVSHAHRQLLVHRDLKPSNVLVTAAGEVKLLDFGIAKALDPLDGADGAATLAGERPFTPHFASPEQVRGEPVGTGTDIYSLGVLLYLLLTGQRPTGRGATSAREAARSVLEETPTRPSALSPGPVADPQWLAHRKRLAGDLDNILLKALDKTVAGRYPSVDAFAADLRAFLGGFPVSARPDHWAYRARKFVGRHRLPVVLATLALGAVLASSALAWQQARRAEARFADLRQLAHAVLFDYHDLIEPLAGATPVRKRLVEDALVYLDRLWQDTPDDRAIRREIGMAYRTVGYVQRNGFRRPHLGDTAGAMRSFDRGVALLDALVAEDPHDAESAYELALVLSARAGVWAEDGDMPRAEPALQRAVALFSRHLPDDPPDRKHRLELARTHLRLADGWMAYGDLAAARGQVGQARAVLDGLAALDPGHAELPHVWVWVHNLASAIARRAGDWATVEAEERRSRERLLALEAQAPANARFQEDLAGNAHWLAMAAAVRHDPDSTERWALDAAERWTALTRQDPDVRGTRLRQLDILTASGLLLVDAGAPARGWQRLQAVDGALRQAARRWPDDVDLRLRLLWQSLALALAAQAADRPEAAAWWADTRQQAAALRQSHGDLPKVQTQLALVDYRSARQAVERALAGRVPPAAQQALAQSVAALEALRQRRALVPMAQVVHLYEGRALLDRLTP